MQHDWKDQLIVLASKKNNNNKKNPKQTKKKRVFNCGHLLKVTAICHYRRALRSSYICRVFAWWCNACVWLCKTMWTRRQWHLADIKYWIIYDVFSKGLHVSLSKLQPTHCLSNRHPWDAHSSLVRTAYYMYMLILLWYYAVQYLFEVCFWGELVIVFLCCGPLKALLLENTSHTKPWEGLQFKWPDVPQLSP